MTAEVIYTIGIFTKSFNSIRKVYPSIIKSLKEKYLIKQKWF